METNRDRTTSLTCGVASSLRVSFRSVLFLAAVSLACAECSAQSSNQLAAKPSPPARTSETEPAELTPAAPVFTSAAGDRVAAQPSEGPLGEESSTKAANTSQSQFRVERTPLVNGAELLTIFARLDGMRASGRAAPEVPLISVVRDTLGDNDPENDRLRYVWMLTYTQPTILKRIASAIPFLYQQVGSKTRVSGPSSPIIDLANTDRQTWNKFFWLGVQNIFLDTYGVPLKASSRSYRRNSSDYRSAHVTQALSILATYENLRQRSRDESEFLASRQGPEDGAATSKTGAAINDFGTLPHPDQTPGFTAGEMLELRARLMLSRKMFGGLFGPAQFQHIVEKRSMESGDIAGHNWEMLRQRAEAEGLYFEPLTMPDGSATHALLWISRTDLATQANRHFSGRFLNIADPWSDQRLRAWNGYSQTRYFDEDNRLVTGNDPQTHRVEMVPLALYGLDHPRIPALLIDFRDGLNPKRRELSRRILRDLAKDVFSLSSFGNVPYFLGHTAFDFVTGRRGMDLNQPSRLHSYSELKLLLSLNGSIDPNLRNEIERRLENVSLNPLTNNNHTEIQLARQQYDSLIDFARRPDGLSARIDRDRRAEMVPLAHGRLARLCFNLGNVLTFGRYVHRERATPQLSARLELARRIKYHTQFLHEVAKSSPQIEVVWNMTGVRGSLRFLVENGAGAKGSAARVAAAIFQRTNDAEARRLCLDALYKINNKTARNELLRIYRDEQPHSDWRVAIAERLRKALAEDSRMKPAEAQSMLNQVGQP
jgi:hypothetical protein